MSAAIRDTAADRGRPGFFRYSCRLLASHMCRSPECASALRFLLCCGCEPGAAAAERVAEALDAACSVLPISCDAPLAPLALRWALTLCDICSHTGSPSAADQQQQPSSQPQAKTAPGEFAKLVGLTDPDAMDAAVRDDDSLLLWERLLDQLGGVGGLSVGMIPILSTPETLEVVNARRFVCFVIHVCTRMEGGAMELVKVLQAAVDACSKTNDLWPWPLLLARIVFTRMPDENPSKDPKVQLVLAYEKWFEGTFRLEKTLKGVLNALIALLPDDTTHWIAEHKKCVRFLDKCDTLVHDYQRRAQVRLNQIAVRQDNWEGNKLLENPGEGLESLTELAKQDPRDAARNALKNHGTPAAQPIATWKGLSFHNISWFADFFDEVERLSSGVKPGDRALLQILQPLPHVSHKRKSSSGSADLSPSQKSRDPPATNKRLETQLVSFAFCVCSTTEKPPEAKLVEVADDIARVITQYAIRDVARLFACLQECLSTVLGPTTYYIRRYDPATFATWTRLFVCRVLCHADLSKHVAAWFKKTLGSTQALADPVAMSLALYLFFGSKSWQHVVEQLSEVPDSLSKFDVLWSLLGLVVECRQVVAPSSSKPVPNFPVPSLCTTPPPSSLLDLKTRLQELLPQEDHRRRLLMEAGVQSFLQESFSVP